MRGLPRGTGAPSYPLSVDAFREALRRGLGRAWVQVHEHGADGLRDVIRDVTTYSRVFDTQVNGHREAYLAAICEGAGLVDELVKRFMAGVAEDEVDWRESKHREQRSALLLVFASRGHTAARDALYAGVRYDRDADDIIGLEPIIELDGDEGLVFAAHTLVEHVENDPDAWCDDHLLYVYDERHGEGAGRALLERRAHDDPKVAAFLAEVDETESDIQELEADERRNPAEAQAPTMSVDEVIEAIRTSDRRLPWLRRWCLDATDTERARVVDLLRGGLSPLALTYTLDTLAGIGPEGLVGVAPEIVTDDIRAAVEQQLLDHLDHDDEDVRHSVAINLGRFSSTAVRATGLAWLSRDAVTGMEALAHAAHPEDASSITAALDTLTVADEHELHSAGTSLVDILTCSELHDVDLALRVYEHTPCAWCRKQAVEALLAWDAAPAWLVAEARHDGDKWVRELVTSA